MNYENEVNDILSIINHPSSSTEYQKLQIMEVLIKVYHKGTISGITSAHDRIKKALNMKDE